MVRKIVKERNIIKNAWLLKQKDVLKGKVNNAEGMHYWDIMPVWYAISTVPLTINGFQLFDDYRNNITYNNISEGTIQVKLEVV